MIDYSDLISFMENHARFKEWANRLPSQIQTGLSIKRYGDLPEWYEALAILPDSKPSCLELNKSITIGKSEDISENHSELIQQAFRRLIPWRKGPYNIFGIDINTEWRSDWKWDRLNQHISSLKDRTVLDVGCGNGYHMLRMLGEKTRRVIGIDPSPRFVVQFYMIKHFLKDCPVDLLPIGIESIPKNLNAFDTTFSMGVLYHRPSPIDHLRQLKTTLKPGGELVLETLIIEGDQNSVLVPEGRYAQMNNVWFLPSASALISWMKKCGFENVRCVNINQTSLEEQRATEWMEYLSLKDFLDPMDKNKTIEGYPAPLRGIFIANLPKK